ncbi:MAG: hypothetical protein H6510_08050 [Acidobacteria bacterium]|nr:hypothetical protein [Acidobacteriota bacterium]MCB9397751.1 hypothetical protein [Acidobacteriota bacterium]
MITLTLITTCLLGFQDPAGLEHAVSQLNHCIGEWQVQTDFLKEDGSVAQSHDGTYQFSWVVQDRVVQGQSQIPALKQTSAILFYLREKSQEIEMVSVGADGKLWIMTGKTAEEVRYSQPFATADGGEAQLRFTRYNVEPDRFESKMEYTQDHGKTWLPGNHQIFTRKNPSP